MIIARTERGLKMTTQVAHGRLSGELCSLWGGHPFRPPVPRESVYLAACLHDEGWGAWTESPRLLPDGTPVDFMRLKPDAHTALYAHGIELALQADEYAGLLVSLHGTGLYLKRHGYMVFLPFVPIAPEYQKVVNNFLTTQQALQQRLIERLQVDLTAMWTHYRWLQCWDLISLFVCLKDGAKREVYQAGSMPTFPGGTERDLTLRGDGENRFRLDPWPFTVSELPLTFPVRYLAHERFESELSYQRAYRLAPEKRLTVWIRPG